MLHVPNYSARRWVERLPASSVNQSACLKKGGKSGRWTAHNAHSAQSVTASIPVKTPSFASVRVSALRQADGAQDQDVGMAPEARLPDGSFPDTFSLQI